MSERDLQRILMRDGDPVQPTGIVHDVDRTPVGDARDGERRHAAQRLAIVERAGEYLACLSQERGLLLDASLRVVELGRSERRGREASEGPCGFEFDVAEHVRRAVVKGERRRHVAADHHRYAEHRPNPLGSERLESADEAPVHGHVFGNNGFGRRGRRNVRIRRDETMREVVGDAGIGLDPPGL